MSNADVVMSPKGAMFIVATISGAFIAGLFLAKTYAVEGQSLCESQAPRVTASTPTNIFNRCTRELPDGTVLIWDRDTQHRKDLASGVALKLE